MDKKPVLVVKDHETWKLSRNWLLLLRACRAEDASRWAFQHFYVGQNTIVATNDRQLCEVTMKHEMQPGLYWPTREGFLLPDPQAGNFPKHESIIVRPKKEDIVACEVPHDDATIAAMVYKINRNGEMALNISMFLEVICALMRIGIREIHLMWGKKEQGPIQIECSMCMGKDVDCLVRYLQMPLYASEEWKK